MHVDGQCFCGYVTFEADIDPDAVELCHCEDCQRLSSSAFRIVVPAIPGSFRLMSGVPTIFVKTAYNGKGRELAFCPKCGTAVYGAPQGGGEGYFGLRVGCLKQRRELVPHQQYWRRSALSWVDHVGDLPGHDTQ